MMEFGLLPWGVREGHWLLPIQGGAVSKTRLAICRGVEGMQGTARDKDSYLHTGRTARDSQRGCISAEAPLVYTSRVYAISDVIVPQFLDQ